MISSPGLERLLDELRERHRAEGVLLDEALALQAGRAALALAGHGDGGAERDVLDLKGRELRRLLASPSRRTQRSRAPARAHATLLKRSMSPRSRLRAVTGVSIPSQFSSTPLPRISIGARMDRGVGVVAVDLRVEAVVVAVGGGDRPVAGGDGADVAGASIARTSKRCAPAVRRSRVMPESHGAKSAVVERHWNVLASLAET